MKKVICLLTALVLALGCFSVSVSAAEYGMVLNNNVALMVGSTTAVARNTLQTLNAAPVEKDGVVMVPTSVVSVLFNGTAVYDSAAGFIDIRFGVDKEAVMKIGSKNYTFNGFGRALEAAPYDEGGTAYIPLKTLVKEIIGQTYFYDAGTKLAIVSSRAVIKDAASDAAVLTTIQSAILTNNLPPISVPTSYEIDWSIPVEETTINTGAAANDNGPITSSMSGSPTGSKVTLSGGMCTFSYEPEANNPGINAIDGSASSVWATEGIQEMVIDLGQAMSISCVGVEMKYYDDSRTINYGIQVSSDGSTYRYVFDGACAAGGGVFEYHTVGVNARYVKVTTNGSSVGSWASVAEIEVYSGSVSAAAATQTNTPAAASKTTSSTGTKLPFTNATFTAEPEANNPGRNAFDGNTNTYWAVENANSMTIDLGSSQPISCVGVQMRNYVGESGDTRTVNFGVALSEDGSSYNNVYNGASAPGGGVMEYVQTNGTNAKYVRINLSGSSTNGWASLAEVEVYTGTGAPAGGSGGSSASATYPNLPSVAGEFIIADPATNNVVTINSDNTSLSVAPYTNASNQIWTAGYNSYGQTVKNNGANVVMDVFEQSMNPGGQIGVWESNDGNNQAWTFELDGNGYYVKNVMSGLCLSNSNGNIVQLDRGSATKWVVADKSATISTGGSVIKGEFQLTPFGTNNALCVTDDAMTLSLDKSSSAKEQFWTLDGSGIKNVGTGNFLDVSEQSMEEGGSIIVWEGNGGINQSWILEQDGLGYYIKSAMSGLYLTDDNGSIQQNAKSSATKWLISGDEVEIAEPVEDVSVPKAIETPVEGIFKISVYGTNDTMTVARDNTLEIDHNFGLDTQRWTMEATEGGFIIRNVATGEVLEISGESVEPGRKVGLWEANGGAHQTWILEKLGGFYYIKNANSDLYICYDATGIRQREFGSATKWTLR